VREVLTCGRSTLFTVTVEDDAAEAARLLRALLDAVAAGELDADGPVGANCVRQMRGAVAALEALTKPKVANKDIDQ
jgi:hypothetical protein